VVRLALVSGHSVRRFPVLRGAWAVVCVLLAMCGTARAQTASYTSGTQNLGSISVGSTASTTRTFTFGAGGTIGAPAVLTQGAAGLDFTDAGTGSCTTNGTSHIYNNGDTCTVDVKFNPAHPGTRYGGVELLKNSGAVIATGYVYGTGVGPQVIFSPGTQSTVADFTNNGLSLPKGVAVDASGNIYIADSGNDRVLKETLSGGSYTQSVVADSTHGSLGYPAGIAVDGAGNVYIADSGHWCVLEAMLSGGSYNQSVIINGLSPGGYGLPYGIAVDGSGNIYISTNGITISQSYVLKYTPSVGSYNLSVVASAFNGLIDPYGVAVDGSGNVYIATTSSNQVLLEKSSGGSYTQSVLVGGLYDPYGVAVDGSGNVYIADSDNNRVVEETLSGGSYTQSVLINSGLSGPYGVAVDGSGNVYIADTSNNQVLKLDYADPPSLAYASTSVGSTSSDSPQTVTLINDGNAPLDISIPATGSNPSITQLTPSFVLGNTGTCPQVTSAAVTVPFIAPGAGCTLTVSFTPVAAGPLTGTLTISDNVLNNAAAAQTIALSATGLPTQPAPYIAPTSINFNTEPAGSTSNFWTVTLNNESGTPLKLALIYLTDAVNFKETNNCPSTLPAYTNCNIQVSFSPSGTGQFNGSLVFLDNGFGSPQSVALTGTGTSNSPTVVYSLTDIPFGTQTVGTTSNSWNVNLSNTSGYPLAISGIVLSDTTDFTQTNTCGSTLAAYSTCNIVVSFTPQTATVITGTLFITDNAYPSTTQTVTLSGTGTSNAPALFFAPPSINFGNQTVGTTSNSWTVTLNNTTAFNSTFTTPIAVTGPFAETNTCGTGLAAHSTCNVVVTFVPTATGTANGLLSVAINGGNLVTPVPLTGVGTTSAPVVVFAPTSVDFGSQVVGTTSNSWTITLNNESGSPATLTSALAITGPFIETNNCGTTLAAYTTCNVVVSFVPVAAGTATGQLTAIVNGISTPLTVALTGTGASATPVVVFSPTSVDFGSQVVGTASNSWTITLNNITSFPAPFAGPLAITGSGDFTQTNSCGTYLAANSTCNVVVTFTPSSTGVINGQLVVLLSGSSTPVTVSLTGTGTTSTPVAIFSPTSIDFGSQTIGTTSNPWTVTLSNTSGTAASLTVPLAIAGSTAFAMVNYCGTSLPAYSTCNIQVTFTPSATGAVTGQLVALINGSSAPLTVALTGTGTSATQVVTFSPTNINFGNQTVGTASNAWTVTLSNTSGTNAVFSSPIAISGSTAFTQNNNCGSVLGAYSTCNVQVTFTPSATGAVTGQLVALINGSITPLTVALTGTGTAATPVLQFSTSSINFGNQTDGTSSSAWTVTLSNTSAFAATYLNIALLGGPFTQTNNCGTYLAPYSSCTMLVTFTPTSPLPYTGVIILQPTTGPVLNINLTGTGLDATPVLTFSPSSINFGNQMVTTSSSWTVTLNNTSGTAATFSSALSILGSGFTQTNNCGTYLAAYSTCTAVITFTPPGAVTFNGLLVVSPTTGAPQTVTLTGTGLPVTSVIFYSPTSIDFGNQLVGTAGNAWTVTLNNTGNAAVAFSGVSLTDTTNFSQTNSCGTYLPAYSTCTIQVNFTPSTTGVINASLTSVIDGVTETVSLTGTGTVPPDYTISVNPSTVTLDAGQTGLATFTFTPVGGFSGTVFFYCTNLPVGVSCIFNPASVTANGSNTVQTASLTIMTTGPYSGTVAMNHVESAPMLAAFFLPGTLLCGLLAWRRKKLGGMMKQWMVLMVLLAVIGGAVGCSGFNHFTPTGTSVVTVTSSASASTTITGTSTPHTAAFTLTISQ